MWISGYSYSRKVHAIMAKMREALNQYIGEPNTEDTRKRIKSAMSRINREFVDCIGLTDTEIEIIELDDNIVISLKLRRDSIYGPGQIWA